MLCRLNSVSRFLACVPSAVRRLAAPNLQRALTTATHMPCKFSSRNAFPWLSRIWRSPAPTKVFRPMAASWSGAMSTDSSGSSSDDKTQEDDSGLGGVDQKLSSGSAACSDDSTAPTKVTVDTGSRKRVASYQKRYYRPYTPGDVSTPVESHFHLHMSRYTYYTRYYTYICVRSVLTRHFLPYSYAQLLKKTLRFTSELFRKSPLMNETHSRTCTSTLPHCNGSITHQFLSLHLRIQNI